MNAVEIAKAVRSEIRAEHKAGKLGKLPAGLKFSVRSDSFAGGSSVDVNISGDDEWAWAERGERISDPCRRLGDKVGRILAKHNKRQTWGGVYYRGVVLETNPVSWWSPGCD